MGLNYGQELTKLKIEHDNALCRIVIEKLLIALIVVAIGFFANQELEKFKHGLADRQHALQTQDKILSDLRDIYDQISRLNHQLITLRVDQKAAGTGPYNELIKNYNKKLGDFHNLINRSGRHLSEDFESRLQQHVWFHQAIAGETKMLGWDDWSFVVGVFENFGSLTRYAVIGDRLDVPPKSKEKSFVLHAWTAKQIDEKKVGGYLDALREKWKGEGR